MHNNSHDPETASWLHDLWGDAGRPKSDETPDALAKFFEGMDLNPLIENSGQRQSKVEVGELRDFIQAEKSAVENHGITRKRVRTSLSALSSILERVSRTI